ncbi:putative esterase [Trichoderma sp. SZMC 28015]
MPTTKLQPEIYQPLLNSIPNHLLSRFDPVFVEYYNKYNVGRLQTHQIPIEEARNNPSKYTISYGRAEGPEVFRVTEQKCAVDGGEITVRIFEPEPCKDGDSTRPVYINYHAGGWTFGGLHYDDPFCRRLTKEIGCVCFDVDYRLAPENPYPTPIEDSWMAFKWIHDEKVREFNLDVNRVAIGGVSAGGHIAAVIAHLARDAGYPLSLQVLAVPCVDLTGVFTRDGKIKADCPYESYRELFDTVGLPAERMMYLHRTFLGSPRPREYENHWKLSPINAQNFANLAPAFIITAEMDILRDEGEAYGRKLMEAGIKVKSHRHKGMPHHFMMMDGILESAMEYNREFEEALKEAFNMA